MNSPIILYLSIIAITCLMALNVEKYNKKARVKAFKPFFFFLTFIIPALFITFTDTGTDYYSYYRIIESRHTLKDIVDDINTEPFFTLWSTIGWGIWKNPHMIIWSMKMGSLLVIFYSFYILRNKIDVFLAIASYMCIAYLLSFYLISIHLAACFISLAFAFILKERYYKGLFFAFIACGMHYSAALAFLPIVAYKFVVSNKAGKKVSSWRMIIVVVVTIIAYYSFTSILASMVSSYEQLEHYGKYIDSMGNGESKGLGIVQIIFYSPIAYILYRIYKNKSYSKSIFVLFLFFSAFGFASAELGYIIPILIRSFFLFIPVFCIILPYYINSLKSQPHESDGIFSWQQLRWIAVLYFLFRLYINFNEYITPDSTSNMYYYRYFNPFS